MFQQGLDAPEVGGRIFDSELERKFVMDAAMVKDVEPEQLPLMDTINRLKARKDYGKLEIFEISDLQDFIKKSDELRQLLDLDFETGLVYTDEGRWFLVSGAKKEVSYGPTIGALFIQGRVLVDIHTHPQEDSLSIADHMEYPSIWDLDYYFRYGNNSVILSKKGISFISRPSTNPLTGESLTRPSYSFTDKNFLRWYNEYFKANTQNVREVDSWGYMVFLTLVGVKFKFLPWHEEETVKILDQYLNSALKSNPLEKLLSSEPSARSQAENFLDRRYEKAGGEIDVWGNKPKSVRLDDLRKHFPSNFSTDQIMESINLYNQSKRPERRIKVDKALIAAPAKDVGGIDFKSDKMNIETKVDSRVRETAPLRGRGNDNSIKFHIDPAMLQELQNAPGFAPVITDIQLLPPGNAGMKELRLFLGLDTKPRGQYTSKV